MLNYKKPNLELVELITEDIIMTSQSYGGEQAGDVEINVWGFLNQ